MAEYTPQLMMREMMNESGQFEISKIGKMLELLKVTKKSQPEFATAIKRAFWEMDLYLGNAEYKNIYDDLPEIIEAKEIHQKIKLL